MEAGVYMNKKCPKCGYAIQDGDQFCINCGYKISQNNKEKLKSMKNEKTGDNSTKSKKQPIKRMKVLEATSSDLYSEQPQEFWKKKSFWGIIVAIALVVLVIRANILPKGYSNPNDVMEYCMKRNGLLNDMQNTAQAQRSIANSYGAYGFFDEDNANTDRWQLLKNKKTKRYVFRYSYDGESIPSYVVMVEYQNGLSQLYITPVNRGHIAGIFKDQVSQKYINKHFPADQYIGYSNDNLEDIDIKLEPHIHEKDHGKDWVWYDSSRNE